MSTFLKLLPLELDGINNSEFIEPQDAPKKGEQQVGEMSDMNKRLFTLSKLLEKDTNQCQLDANYCNDKVKKLELEAKTRELATKSHAITTIMWISIADEFGLWDINFGVRSGFKVVSIPDTGSDIPPFLRKLLEG